MSDHPMSPVVAADQPRVLATLSSAFATDPVERWLYPDDAVYAEHFPEFISAVADRAYETRTAWQLDDFAAVALMLPPGTGTDPERIAALLVDTVAAEKHADMFAVLARMEAAHPRYPHWYLPWLGVDAARQSHGIGGQLLAACLDYIDVGRLPVYLETPNPRNIPFYERHGFVLVGSAESGSCPPVSFMLRPAAE